MMALCDVLCFSTPTTLLPVFQLGSIKVSWGQLRLGLSQGELVRGRARLVVVVEVCEIVDEKW